MMHCSVWYFYTITKNLEKKLREDGMRENRLCNFILVLSKNNPTTDTCYLAITGYVGAAINISLIKTLKNVYVSN